MLSLSLLASWTGIWSIGHPALVAIGVVFLRNPFSAFFSLAFSTPAPETLRNGDSHYRYRQSSDLLYLTGFAEPESCLVFRPGADKERVVLFVSNDP